MADGALRAAADRPNVLVRYPNGIDSDFFYQKRAPASRPDWIEVVELQVPSGRTAEELVPRDAAALAWMANLACLELHPHPVRADDLDHPDELRIDLDPVPGIEWPQIREVASVVRAQKEDAQAGFERWKARHPAVVEHLQPADVLVDAMRGRFRMWTRVRVNLQHVPEAPRPPQEPLDPDEDMADDWKAATGP